MTAPAAAPARPEPLADLLVVDTDVHVHESPAALAEHIEMPWRVSLEHLAKVPERYLDLPGFSPGSGALEAPFPSGHEAARAVHDPKQMRAELTAIGVNVGVLFPDHLLKLPVLTQADYAAALARAYNRWLTDVWAGAEPGLVGCVVACPQDPEDAAREIERYADHPAIVGVYLPCAGIDPLWGHRRYDAIYAAAEAADLPVVLHSVTVTHPVFPCNNHGFDTGLGRHAVGHTFSIIANVIHMVTTGVVVRFPELRIAVAEAGLAWMPFVMTRLDKEYVEHRRDVPFLTERPSHYLRRFYVGTQPVEEPERRRDVLTLIELFDGQDTAIFASDWPHHDFDHPRKLDQVPLGPELRRKVFGENALRLFKIDSQGRRV
jgi:predicted TIM-barrel fold metal-dependent hydrolase